MAYTSHETESVLSILLSTDLVHVAQSDRPDMVDYFWPYTLFKIHLLAIDLHQDGRSTNYHTCLFIELISFV